MELIRLLVVSYSDEGDFIPSIFAKYFEISRYDDTVREAEYYEEASNDLNQLLEGFSYDDEIVPIFVTLVKEELPNDINAVVLLYNFKYAEQRNVRHVWFKEHEISMELVEKERGESVCQKNN